MIEFLGWTTFTLGGAWAVFCATAFTMTCRGGLEVLPRMLVLSILTSCAWIAFALWLSPLTVTVQ